MAIFFGPAPWGGVKKVKYLISITKSISKIFIQNCVCILTNERYKTYRTGFSFCCLDHALGVGLGGTYGSKLNSVPHSVYYVNSSQIITLNSTKFGVWVTHMNEACNGKNKFGPAPWGGSKDQISLNFNYSQFQRFLYQTLGVFSQMTDTKHIRLDFHSVTSVMN